jgi:hypothetical protein
MLHKFVKLDRTMTANQVRLLCTIMKNDVKFFMVALSLNIIPNGAVILVPYDLRSQNWVISLLADGSKLEYNRLDLFTPAPLNSAQIEEIVGNVRNFISRITRRASLLLRQPSKASIFDQHNKPSNEVDYPLALSGPADPFPNGVGGGGLINSTLITTNLSGLTPSTFNTTSSTPSTNTGYAQPLPNSPSLSIATTGRLAREARDNAAEAERLSRDARDRCKRIGRRLPSAERAARRGEQQSDLESSSDREDDGDGDGSGDGGRPRDPRNESPAELDAAISTDRAEEQQPANDEQNPLNDE